MVLGHNSNKTKQGWSTTTLYYCKKSAEWETKVKHKVRILTSVKFDANLHPCRFVTFPVLADLHGGFPQFMVSRTWHTSRTDLFRRSKRISGMLAQIEELTHVQKTQHISISKRRTLNRRTLHCSQHLLYQPADWKFEAQWDVKRIEVYLLPRFAWQITVYSSTNSLLTSKDKVVSLFSYQVMKASFESSFSMFIANFTATDGFPPAYTRKL